MKRFPAPAGDPDRGDAFSGCDDMWTRALRLSFGIAFRAGRIRAECLTKNAKLRDDFSSFRNIPVFSMKDK